MVAWHAPTLPPSPELRKRQDHKIVPSPPLPGDLEEVARSGCIVTASTSPTRTTVLPAQVERWRSAATMRNLPRSQATGHVPRRPTMTAADPTLQARRDGRGVVPATKGPVPLTPVQRQRVAAARRASVAPQP